MAMLFGNSSAFLLPVRVLAGIMPRQRLWKTTHQEQKYDTSNKIVAGIGRESGVPSLKRRNPVEVPAGPTVYIE